MQTLAVHCYDYRQLEHRASNINNLHAGTLRSHDRNGLSFVGHAGVYLSQQRPSKQRGLSIANKQTARSDKGTPTQKLRGRAIADIKNLLIAFDRDSPEPIEDWMNEIFWECHITPVIPRLNISLRTLFPHIDAEYGPIFIGPFDEPPAPTVIPPLGDDHLYISLLFPITRLPSGFGFQFGNEILCKEVRMQFKLFLEQWKNELELLEIKELPPGTEPRRSRLPIAEQIHRRVMVESRVHQKQLGQGDRFDAYHTWAGSSDGQEWFEKAIEISSAKPILRKEIKKLILADLKKPHEAIAMLLNSKNGRYKRWVNENPTTTTDE